MKDKKFKVRGMSCAACVARVEKAVRSVEGVSDCEVNLLLGSMRVKGDAEEEAILSAVKAGGYEAIPQGGKEKTPSSDDSETETLKQKKKILYRLIPSSLLLLLLMYISMGHIMWGWPLPDFLSENPLSIALSELLLSGLIMVINKDFFVSGARSAVHLAPNMDALVSLGSLTSFLYSVYVLFLMSADLLRGDISLSFHRLHSVYFESAAMILVLITVGKLLEAIAKGKTTSAIRSLMDLTPKMALVIRGDTEILIPAEEILPSDIFIVKRGENIPADGELIEGNISVDESPLTGESAPVDKKAGSPVFGATAVLSGYAKVKALKVGEETAMAKIIEMVKEASGSKAPVAKAADKVAGIFVPIVLLISVITFAAWMIAAGELAMAVNYSVSVLVISCPCALGLATPCAIMVGSGVGAKKGILFKNAASLEAAGRIKAIAFDKTGTITEGKPEVSEIIPIGIDEEKLIMLAVSLEAKSEHPLASAINAFAKEKGILPLPAENFLAEDGGVCAFVNKEAVFGGNLKYINSKCRKNQTDNKSGGNGSGDDIEETVKRLSEEGKTVLVFANTEKILGAIAVSDKIRDDSKETVSELEKLGLKTVMITGDNSRSAAYVAERVGISEVISEVFPSEKAEHLKKISEKYGSVAMVGDGINDSVALTAAELGISVGSGADIAKDSAGVVLRRSNLSDVAAAVRLGRRTLLNIYENLFWAFIYNIIGIPLAAGVFMPVFGWKLSPMFGAAAMSISSFIVVMNALRLNLYNPCRNGKTAVKQTIVDKKENKMKNVTIKIEGMMCPHCSGRVKSALEAHSSVASADVSHERGDAVVILKNDTDIAELEKIVADSGYTVLK